MTNYDGWNLFVGGPYDLEWRKVGRVDGKLVPTHHGITDSHIPRTYTKHLLTDVNGHRHPVYVCEGTSFDWALQEFRGEMARVRERQEQQREHEEAMRLDVVEPPQPFDGLQPVAVVETLDDFIGRCLSPTR